MIRILDMSDLHWGAIPAKSMELQYSYILYLLEIVDFDLIVITGDYWDFKLLLESDNAIAGAKWFDELYTIAKNRGVKRFRIIKGTDSHDNDQLEIFRKYEDEDGFFRIITKCTSEETLPNLQCLYCPEELLSTKKYIQTYTNELLQGNQICFFHGSFDTVIAQDIDINNLDEENNTSLTSIIFPRAYFEKIIKGVIVGGHWHDGPSYGMVHYTGNPTCWSHGEPNPKGVMIIEYNESEDTFYLKKITNPLSPRYVTIELREEDLRDQQCFLNNIIEDSDLMLKKAEENSEELHIRILVYDLDNNNITIQNAVQTLRLYYAKNDMVKVTVKKKKKKDKKSSSNNDPNDAQELDLSFIHDPNIGMTEMLHEYILKKTGEDIPMEYLEAKINAYKK